MKSMTPAHSENLEIEKEGARNRGFLSWRGCRQIMISLAVVFLSLGGCTLNGTEEKPVSENPMSLEVATEKTVREAGLAPPAWRIGDEWIYSDGYGLRVANLDDGQPGLTRMVRTDDEEQWIRLSWLVRNSWQSRTKLRRIIFRTRDPLTLFDQPTKTPIVLQRELLSGKALFKQTSSWIIEGREKVHVPAGTFDTWVVTKRVRNPSTGWTEFERFWYSPIVRNYVRAEYRYGDRVESTRVLERYTLFGEDGGNASKKSSKPRSTS